MLQKTVLGPEWQWRWWVCSKYHAVMKLKFTIYTNCIYALTQARQSPSWNWIGLRTWHISCFATWWNLSSS